MTNPLVDEELTDEELAQLQQDTDMSDLPDGDDEDMGGEPPRQDTKEPDAEAGDKPEGDQDQDADDDFRAFMEKHKGKSQEELAKLAWQQNQARKEARHNGRQAQDQLGQLLDKIKQSQHARQQTAEQKKQEFDRELQNDPDAATKRLHNEMLERDQQQATQAEWETYIEEQRRMTREQIPDFDQAAPEIMRYAVEEMGFSPQEVQQAADYRQLVMANHSRILTNLVRQGVVDQSGNVLGTQPQSGAQGTMQRAQAASEKEAPRSMSDVRGGRSGANRNSLVKQAEELLAKDDMDVSGDDLDALLRELG